VEVILIKCFVQGIWALFIYVGPTHVAEATVERGEVWNYLVYGKSLYTDSEMKNYRSCNSYKIINGEGLFFYFKCLKLTNLNVICSAKVHHSMAFSLPPLRPWVLLTKQAV